MTAGADPAGQFGTIGRDLWVEVIRGLDSNDVSVRRAAFHRMLAAGPASWDVEIEDLDQEPDGREERRPQVGPEDQKESKLTYEDRVQRMNAAFMTMLDHVPVAYRREGDPEVVERCGRFIEVERAEIERERRQKGRPDLGPEVDE